MNAGNHAAPGWGGLVDRVVGWARLPRASAVLCAVSFAESIFFPIAVDVMLVPMCAASPRRMLRLVTLTTAFSVAGGLAGLMLGYLAIDAFTPWLERLGWGDEFARVENWYRRWGYWALIMAAFTPLPYKVFAISAGGLGMGVGAFLTASVIGRGLRFFLVGGLAAWLGPRALRALRYSDALGWVLAGLAAAALALWWYL